LTVDLKVGFENGIGDVNMAMAMGGGGRGGVGIVVGGVGERLLWRVQS